MIPSISLDEILEFRTARFKSSFELVAKKGHDYNRQQQIGGDTLFNLKVCELLGAVEYAEQGVLTRLTDKLMRLISLTSRPGVENAVKDESVINTVDDIHNYVDYLALMFLKRKEAEKLEHDLLNSGPANPKLKLREELGVGPNYCIDCKEKLGGLFYGAGDGSGQKFRCPKCHAYAQNDSKPFANNESTSSPFRP